MQAWDAIRSLFNPSFLSTDTETLDVLVTSTIRFENLPFNDLVQTMPRMTFEASFRSQLAEAAGVDSGNVALNSITPGTEFDLGVNRY